MISELRAVTLVPGLEPNARNAGEKRLAAGGCQPCWGGAGGAEPWGSPFSSPTCPTPTCLSRLPVPSPVSAQVRLPRRRVQVALKVQCVPPG